MRTSVIFTAFIWGIFSLFISSGGTRCEVFSHSQTKQTVEKWKCIVQGDQSLKLDKLPNGCAFSQDPFFLWILVSLYMKGKSHTRLHMITFIQHYTMISFVPRCHKVSPHKAAVVNWFVTSLRLWLAQSLPKFLGEKRRMVDYPAASKYPVVWHGGPAHEGLSKWLHFSSRHFGFTLIQPLLQTWKRILQSCANQGKV